MPIKKYLSICYAITFFAVLIAGSFLFKWNSTPSFFQILLFAVLLATVNTFVQIWPFANMVPKEKRDSFWSYRFPSVLFIAVPVGAIALGLLGEIIKWVGGF